MENLGMVLEGGGMRGLYTAGVLEYFLENELFFEYVIGVSAGACMAASYLSRQKGRNKTVNIDLAQDPRYLSFRNFLRNRELFGMDFLFDEIPNRLNLFDFETFLAGPEKFVVATTDCATGEAVYYTKQEHSENMLKILRASSSLPFVAPPVDYDGKKLLDGGIVDPIPIKKAQQDGYRKNVIIMTKEEGYRKKPSNMASMAKLLYRQYPNIASTLKKRYKIYNDTIDYIHSEVEKGNIYVIQPSANIPVGRVERNQQKLRDLYELGYQDAQHHFTSLKEWIRK